MLDNPVLSVSELSDYIKGLFDADVLLHSVWVKGEVSNCREYQLGGQLYFTLKDNESQISCVVFQSVLPGIKFKIQDGQTIVVSGKVTVFRKRGTYNLQVFYAEPAGIGALALAFEQLKNKLSDEGLFDPERKKPLPAYPRHIAIAASPDGAAVQDVISVISRRSPITNLYIIPTIVQGADAPDSICAAIDTANSNAKIELLILARGGGSLEELWAFNDEAVARAIACSEIPVVSAVGHEVDYTIADFVADLRAPTPSVAGELVVPDLSSLPGELKDIRDGLDQMLFGIITDSQERLLEDARELEERMDNIVIKKRQVLEFNTAKLKLLNPKAILARGYSITYRSDGQILRSVAEVNRGDWLRTVLKDGEIESEV